MHCAYYFEIKLVSVRPSLTEVLSLENLLGHPFERRVWMNYQLYLQLVGSPGGIRGDKQFRWKDHVGIHKKDAMQGGDLTS